MHFNDCITTRQSCRNYDTKKVEQSVLLDICRQSLFSPSACNSQPWKLVLVHTDDRLDATRKAFSSPFMAQVPAYVVICETKANLMTSVIDRTGDSQYFAQIDVGILAAFMTLAATDKGLGSCIVGMFDEQLLRKELALSKDCKPRLAIALGYPAADDKLRQKSRKPIDDMLTVL